MHRPLIIENIGVIPRKQDHVRYTLRRKKRFDLGGIQLRCSIVITNNKTNGHLTDMRLD